MLVLATRTAIPPIHSIRPTAIRRLWHIAPGFVVAAAAKRRPLATAPRSSDAVAPLDWRLPRNRATGPRLRRAAARAARAAPAANSGAPCFSAVKDRGGKRPI